MSRNNFSNTYAIIINGADVNTKLNLEVPEQELTFLLIKDNIATLYVRAKKEIHRLKF